jgi:anti-anti-sigma regulatory factor
MLSTAGGLMLVDVEGDLNAPALRRWREVLNSAITGGATGVTVDLRGCRVIDIGCLSVLVAASGKLKARGDGGINLVTTPGSPLERRVRVSAAKGLDGYSSAGEALRSLRVAT